MAARRDLRHRTALLATLTGELDALTALLTEAPDAADEAAHQLRRTADTARRVGLDALADAASRAAQEMGGPRWRIALRDVARAAATDADASPFAPLAIVATSGRAAAFSRHAETTTERLIVVPHAAALRALAVTDRPGAVIAGADDPTALKAIAAEWPITLAFAEGPASVRAAALGAGARALVPEDDPEAALDAARWELWKGTERAVVAQLGGDESWSRSIDEAGLTRVPAVSDVAALADGAAPDALLVVTGRDPTLWVRTLRAHPRWARCVVATSQPCDEADLHLPGPARAGEQVARAVARMRRLPSDRDAVTGLLDRRAGFRAIDRWLSFARRSGAPFAIGVLRLDGRDAPTADHGAPAQTEALRQVAAALGATVRRLDVLCRVTGGIFVIGLPSCPADDASKRLSEAAERARTLLRGDPRFAGLTLTTGAADTTQAADRPLDRAWAALATASPHRV